VAVRIHDNRRGAVRQRSAIADGRRSSCRQTQKLRNIVLSRAIDQCVVDVLPSNCTSESTAADCRPGIKLLADYRDEAIGGRLYCDIKKPMASFASGSDSTASLIIS